MAPMWHLRGQSRCLLGKFESELPALMISLKFLSRGGDWPRLNDSHARTPIG